MAIQNLDKDAWLAGFIDADGSFGICNTKKGVAAKKRQIRCRFRLEQRMLDPKTGADYRPVLLSIAEFLCVKLNTRSQKNTGRTYFLIEMSSIISVNKLRTYLSQYPLWSSKFLDFKDWCKAHDLIINKTQYTEAGLVLIETLKESSNNGRSF